MSSCDFGMSSELKTDGCTSLVGHTMSLFECFPRENLILVEWRLQILIPTWSTADKRFEHWYILHSLIILSSVRRYYKFFFSSQDLRSNRLRPHAWKVTFSEVPVVVERTRGFPSDATCQAAERKWEFGATSDADQHDLCSTDSRRAERWKTGANELVKLTSCRPPLPFRSL